MKAALGSILAGLLVFQGSVTVLPLSDAVKVCLGVAVSVIVASLSAYLGRATATKVGGLSGNTTP